MLERAPEGRPGKEAMLDQKPQIKRRGGAATTTFLVLIGRGEPH